MERDFNIELFTVEDVCKYSGPIAAQVEHGSFDTESSHLKTLKASSIPNVSISMLELTDDSERSSRNYLVSNDFLIQLAKKILQEFEPESLDRKARL